MFNLYKYLAIILFLFHLANVSVRAVATDRIDSPLKSVSEDCLSDNKQLKEHIIILQEAAPSIANLLNRIGLSANHDHVKHVYNNTAFRGFSVDMSSDCAARLSTMSDVKHVERSQAIVLHQSIQLRPQATWGMQRISSSGPVDGDTSLLNYTYSYNSEGLGNGADVYVVDTGINVQNQAFRGRARLGFSYFQDTNDTNGHGTHVSGTAASYVFGIAPGANLIAVKVLGPSGAGSTTSTIAGIDYVIQQHDFRKSQPSFVGSVMNLSWGITGFSSAIAHAIISAAKSGIHVAMAAGNDGGDACFNCPASSGGINSSSLVTVGSIGNTARISSFSDTGPCVDIYAPGENVLSAWLGQDDVNYLDGTSMATPHVTGLMAYLMVANSTLAQSPSAMKTHLLEMSLDNIVVGKTIRGDKRRLLNNGVTRQL